MKILVTSSGNSNALGYAISTCEYLVKKGAKVSVEEQLHHSSNSYRLAKTADKFDLIIVFGGDGTILRTFSNWKDAPFLGVNCGRVGFLTEITPEQIYEALAKIDNNEFSYETHRAISVYSNQCSSTSAINDIVVAPDKNGGVITLKIEVNDKHLYTTSGSGIIVSTTTGSSAYALSAGGSLIMPDVDAFILVPVCPFLGRTFPIVISPNSKVAITNLSKYRIPQVLVDGQKYCSLEHNEKVIVTKSSDDVKFIRFQDNFLERVRSKLIKLSPEDLYG